MSFITKRERVFNEYDLFDLPARNEGKLKAYSSCTDARAWSHFCSDKTEHLVEIIKRNNETVRPKYIPTDVIVNTLMSSKNAEIARLKRKIEEFEQMLAAYDDLDLTCDQKCDIANAHAAIKAANKELDEMFLDLDLSGFTEGIDSEAFETGKSRGDEPSRYTGETGKSRGDEWSMGKVSTPRMQTKSNQIGTTCKCDASTSAHDKRIDELQETIISKDAKLSAMQNTIAVMENDVCEPYCIYAHIYTALEKIFATLCQNEKYKQYLDLLTAGKDTRGIDVKGKILFKMKILEKFSLALIAPCSQNSSSEHRDCSCYRAEIVTHVETTFALTSAESKIPSIDNKRAQLVADIMQNDDMKEILSKESLCTKLEDDELIDSYTIENYSIDVQNLKRLKNLQLNYDELLNCYDNLKHERDTLNIRCLKYVELENECECLQNKLREYNQLWKEKEYYRKRSEDLDTLKENYYILSEETANIETKLKAEQEINKTKCGTVDELRNENIKLENKICEISVAFEKQRNVLICKLKECECKMMCQEQQIASLTNQVESLLSGDNNKILQNEDESRSMELIDEIKSQKEQIENLKDALCCKEEEKQYFQEEFDKNLAIINELKLEIEDWKRKYEETNDYLGNYLEKCQMEINKLQNSNDTAIENLNHIIHSKSQEISYLTGEVERKNIENDELTEQVKSIHDEFEKRMSLLASEKQVLLNSIHSARKESLEILERVKNYNNEYDNVSNESLESNDQKQNRNMGKEIDLNVKTDNVNFLKEIQLLREINQENINVLQKENEQLKRSFEVANKETENLKMELMKQEDYMEKFKKLTESHEKLLNEKERLQTDLNNKTNELDNMIHAYQLTKKESETLIDQLHKSESIQDQYIRLNEAYKKIIVDKNVLQMKLLQSEKEFKEICQSQGKIIEENELLHLNLEDKLNLEKKISDLKENYNKLKEANIILQKDYNSKTSEINDLFNKLENKNIENRDLNMKINNLEAFECFANKEIHSLKGKNSNMQLTLNSLKNETSDLKDKLKHYEQIENNFKDLTFAYGKLKLEKDNLQKDLQMQLEHIKKLQQDNCNLNNESKTLLMHSEDLEKALLHARDENLMQTDSLRVYCNDIKKEIDSLRLEKMSYHKKISDVLDKLEESEFLRRNLDEMIISKDKKITTLENHINELEDEIRRLQYNLNEVIETGEQMKQLSYEKIDQSLKTIEANHSKATHNMKIELAKLQNKNAYLESQRSSTKLDTEDAYNKEHDYLKRIKDLQNERLEIVSKIKQLELNSIGDSNLSPITCTVNDIIVSLDRINKLINEKNTHLEKTLLKVQASYQLLKSKAEEAKKIAEEERLKIINEKGEIHKERKILEDQLENLRNEGVNYEIRIQDLQGEIMNQTLVFNRFKQLSENDIEKLQDEKVSLQELYNNSLNVIKDLQEKFNIEVMDKNTSKAEIEKLNAVIEEKNEEILKFKNYIQKITSTSFQHFSAQTMPLTNSADVESQTDPQSTFSDNLNKTSNYAPGFVKLQDREEERRNLNISKSSKAKNVDPTFDSVKCVYINYKLKQLSLGRLEHYSITDIQEILNNDKGKIYQNLSDVKASVLSNSDRSVKKSSIIDIFSTREFTNSTKNTSENDNFTCKNQSESLGTSTVITSEQNNNIFNVNELKENITLNGTISSSDKDMFLIYKESQSACDQGNIENRSWPQNGYTNMIVERATIHLKEVPTYRRRKSTQSIGENSNYDGNDDDSVKPKLNIDLPRVFAELSTSTLSDDDKKSLESYSKTINDSPERKIYSDTKITKFSKNTKKSNVASTSLNVHRDRNPKTIQNFMFEDQSNSKQEIDRKSVSMSQWSSSDVNANNKQVLETQSPIESIYNTNSDPSLSRTNGNIAILKNIEYDDTPNQIKNNYALNYILNSIQNNVDFNYKQNLGNIKALRKSNSERILSFNSGSNQSDQSSCFQVYKNFNKKSNTAVTDRGILIKLDRVQDYESKIQQLSDALKNMEKDYKKKIEAVKIQYESNIKHIMSEHNQGVESIQNLHEEAVREIINKHENEIENLRAMSIEALRKAEKLENENRSLKLKKSNNNNLTLDEVPVRILPSEIKKKRSRSRPENRTLTKTIIDAFNVKPKRRSHGPCTCSLDMNISDTIRNIFKQVDVEQRQMAEIAYLKYIANKIFNDNVEVLDAQELSFLHLKVCRTWKARLNKEETLQKRIDSLESELMNKQRQTQKNMADLDRKVAEEWRLLQEVREAVCRGNSNATHDITLEPTSKAPAIAEKDDCYCNSVSCNIAIEERRSAGDLEPKQVSGIKPKRGKLETNRAVLAKLDTDQRREKKFYTDETPTRLRRSHDRQYTRTTKK